MPGTSEPDNTAEDNGAEDVRAQFRAALERKQAKAKEGASHADGSSKIHEAHGPASSRRTFRRKSGG
ncbi:MAG TPA: DUF5302 domain-containing protein [Actinophytocola sp.]|uniref:DUF5302 domain-containing protein n=1 Tax=Actinophytocola sp. TaxID=1872138 RepID=UPI002DB6A52A|nr:DUF5302 domain-containing protein [Actinophytocola sp.]HEU5476090.1 DUF5302 domain-containing protein [Actinophytocola sp.]